MSYCRWSSDDFTCDVYCYEHVDGHWAIHVATNRVVGDVPHIDWSLLHKGEEGTAAWVAQNKAQHAFLDQCEHEPIGLPHDGETFREDTPADAAVRLRALKAIGYHVPDYAIEALDEEAVALSPPPHPGGEGR